MCKFLSKLFCKEQEVKHQEVTVNFEKPKELLIKRTTEAPDYYEEQLEEFYREGYRLIQVIGHVNNFVYILER